MDFQSNAPRAFGLPPSGSLSRSPLDDLRNSTSIRFVMANGRLYDAATMDQVSPTPVQRPALWFERDGASDAAVWTEFSVHQD